MLYDLCKERQTFLFWTEISSKFSKYLSTISTVFYNYYRHINLWFLMLFWLWLLLISLYKLIKIITDPLRYLNVFYYLCVWVCVCVYPKYKYNPFSPYWYIYVCFKTNHLVLDNQLVFSSQGILFLPLSAFPSCLFFFVYMSLLVSSFFSLCLGRHVSETLGAPCDIPRRHSPTANSLFFWLLYFFHNTHPFPHWSLRPRCRCCVGDVTFSNRVHRFVFLIRCGVL